ncbi:hypothetical protein JKP88DRAFT_233038 [Tribonema minus]|uniref:Secreted peptide n=1 Tax=Tribonema minus TaxID=303371 RepID=A0A836CN88_9STRA|nr:hypothetical protein JKP88DRAFT_233038 [Tribonema minus]
MSLAAALLLLVSLLLVTAVLVLPADGAGFLCDATSALLAAGAFLLAGGRSPGSSTAAFFESAALASINDGCLR